MTRPPDDPRSADAPAPEPLGVDIPAFPPAGAPEPPAGSDPLLNPRRERFCRYYLTEPSATRAAVKAGYSPRGAGQAAHRMLKNVEILQRIDALRRTENLVYDLSPQAVMDRCEAIFEESLENGRYEAAIGALRLQAKIGGLLRPDHLPAPKRDLAGAIDYAVKTAVSKYVTFGTVGSLNHLAPPPWPPGEEAARRTRRKMEKEQEDSRRETPSGQELGWSGDEASAFRAAVTHEDEFQRAAGLDPITPVMPNWTPPEVRTETEKAYTVGRTPDPHEPPLDYAFPPEDKTNKDDGDSST